jgi:hypothetical protein
MNALCPDRWLVFKRFIFTTDMYFSTRAEYELAIIAQGRHPVEQAWSWTGGRGGSMKEQSADKN